MIESKLTREEAIKLLHDELWSGYGDKTAPTKWVDIWEKLGIVKFTEPERKIEKLYTQHGTEFGTIQVERWPEGLVVWVGGQIVYRSWELTETGIKKCREKFRANLADANLAEYTKWSSPVLKAFDDAFDLRERK